MGENKPTNIQCPDCGGAMIPRTSVHGKFWGCASFPRCRGTRDSNGMSKQDRENERMQREMEASDDYYVTKRDDYTFTRDRNRDRKE